MPARQLPFNYGGQAVIEGVLMRGPRQVAVAVRVGEEINLKREDYSPWNKKWPFLGWPLIRGTVVLFESLILGVGALNHSACLLAGEEGEEISNLELILTVAFAVLLGTGLFILLPAWLGHLTQPWMNNLGQNLVEGIIRLGIFLLYLFFLGKFPDIRRVFEYHGAEHKVINTFEDGAELTAAEAAKRSPLNPGCGTSFLLVVLVISIVVFAFLGNGPWWWRFGSRLVLLPLVAGLAYEFIRFSRRCNYRWLQMLAAPGLWLQKLTTREPDTQQLEVAISALRAVLSSSEGNSGVSGGEA